MAPVIVPGGPGRIPRALGQIVRDSFFINAVNFTLAGAENLQNSIQIQSDAHFLCVMTMYDTNVAAGVAGAAFGGSLIQLTDGATAQQLSNIQVAASTLFGTAQRPYWWPLTHLFRASGFIGISITGIAAATAQTVRLSFGGYKVPKNAIDLAALSMGVSQ